MTAFICNTRNNPISTIKENVSSDANFKTFESPVISETANLILILENKLLSRFNGQKSMTQKKS